MNPVEAHGLDTIRRVHAEQKFETDGQVLMSRVTLESFAGVGADHQGRIV